MLETVIWVQVSWQRKRVKWCVCQFLEKQFLPFGCGTETLWCPGQCSCGAGDQPAVGPGVSRPSSGTEHQTCAVTEHEDGKTGGEFPSGQKVQKGVVWPGKEWGRWAHGCFERHPVYLQNCFCKALTWICGQSLRELVCVNFSRSFVREARHCIGMTSKLFISQPGDKSDYSLGTLCVCWAWVKCCCSAVQFSCVKWLLEQECPLLCEPSSSYSLWEDE